ncbi:unnamed protein product, partial [Sphagnum troendelagicum]
MHKLALSFNHLPNHTVNVDLFSLFIPRLLVAFQLNISMHSIAWSLDNEMLWKTLRISYDHLIKTHQDMFLDIACFFVDLKKNTFYRVYWNGDGSSSIMLILQNLKDRSLIKCAED